ncbi:MAG: N-acetylmuramoyl-L-alanine amidase [Verrucomicrobia bacterium]|nr:N-acetylmuramoyl-L-alanine amidase [Verrucomicrobiota bacterium]
MRRSIYIFSAVLFAALCLQTLKANASSSRQLRQLNHDGRMFLRLQDIATHYGLKISKGGDTVSMRSKWSILDFETDSRKVTVNGVQIWLNAPVQRVRGYWSISQTDMDLVIDPLFRAQDYLGHEGYRTVVLDPGHGGQDSGAQGKRKVQEKRVVLDVSRRAAKILEKSGVNVRMTRSGDRFIELEERAKLAARWKADLFVSVHANSSTSSKASGIESFVLALPGYHSTNSSLDRPPPTQKARANKFDAANVILGYYLQREMLERTGAEDRGLRRARFVVLKEAPCPAALVECGFVSNKSEEAKMLDAGYRQAIAEGIAKGILDYLNSAKKARLAMP